jgi:signal transduction histidine kinase
VITRFRLYNRAVPVSHAKHSILTNNIAYTDHIELSHKQHDISFEFAALDYSRPERNAYAYILEGFAKEWTKTSAANRIASFTNLRPGKYVFRVKGSNNDGIWNEEGASVTVVIHKPWWGTHFAWCMYTLAFISMVFSYISLRTRSLRKEKIVLEQQVSERTQKIELQRAELKSANTQLETKQKELQSVNLRLEEQKEELIQQKEELQSTLENLKKTQDQLIESEKMAALGRLVTGIAHEINIPVGIGITAISSLLEDVQKTTVQYEKEEISARNFKGFLESTMDTAKLIRKNLERTSSLIRSFRQVSSDQITEQKRSFLFRDYYNDILLSLRPKFRGKNIEFRVVCDDKLMLNSYPGVYAQIFTNLLVNSLQHGFYAKNSGIITLNAEMDGDLLRIQYRDDGEGISKKDLPHIFEPFYSSGQCIGTGLGLNIVYNLIRQKLHGTIACESELGKGVLFQIEVPL